MNIRTAKARTRLVVGILIGLGMVALAVPVLLTGMGLWGVLGIWAATAGLVFVSFVLGALGDRLLAWMDRGE